jgi:hypothetical protein
MGRARHPFSLGTSGVHPCKAVSKRSPNAFEARKLEVRRHRLAFTEVPPRISSPSLCDVRGGSAGTTPRHQPQLQGAKPTARVDRRGHARRQLQRVVRGRPGGTRAFTVVENRHWRPTMCGLTPLGLRWQVLVFSDEFDTPGRTFIDGEDPRWTALQSAPANNGQLNWYNQSLASTTTDAEGRGVLELRMSAESVTPEYSTEKRYFQTAMIQGWNKFCFQGGIVEFSARLPGTPTLSGPWPAFWMMGNLGRATIGKSTDGIWPWTFEACPEDRVANQVDGQRISGCNSNPGYGLNPNQGRGGAPSASEQQAATPATPVTPASVRPGRARMSRCARGGGTAFCACLLRPLRLWRLPQTHLGAVCDGADDTRWCDARRGSAGDRHHRSTARIARTPQRRRGDGRAVRRQVPQCWLSRPPGHGARLQRDVRMGRRPPVGHRDTSVHRGARQVSSATGLDDPHDRARTAPRK